MTSEVPIMFKSSLDTFMEEAKDTVWVVSSMHRGQHMTAFHINLSAWNYDGKPVMFKAETTEAMTYDEYNMSKASLKNKGIIERVEERLRSEGYEVKDGGFAPGDNFLLGVLEIENYTR